MLFFNLLFLTGSSLAFSTGRSPFQASDSTSFVQSSSSSLSAPNNSSLSNLSLLFSTFFGGNDSDLANSIAIDQAGNIYLTGTTYSSYFPIKDAYNVTYGGNGDVFVAKFTSTGILVFSTVFGGSSGDEGEGIAVDSVGNCFITGHTLSNDFPTKNAFNNSLGGLQDAFVAKINATGGLVFSTFFGGKFGDFGNDIAVDSADNIFITGFTQSPNFPTKNAFNSTFGGGNGDAFVAKFNAAGDLVFSSFFGGNSTDSAHGIIVDSVGNSYITGTTSSSNFPTKNAYNATYGGGMADSFLAKFDSNGKLLFSTYFGGNGDDESQAIAIDSAGNSLITGYTLETFSYNTSQSIPNNFPTKHAFNATTGGFNDAFLAKFDSHGQLVFSTFLGGNDLEIGYAIAVDSAGNSYTTGTTSSSNFPTKFAYNTTYGGSGNSYGWFGDAFVTKFSSTGSLVYSTYLGGDSSDVGTGIAVDSAGDCFITGYTFSNNFPTFSAFNASYSGREDAFITKFSYFPEPLVTGQQHRGIYSSFSNFVGNQVIQGVIVFIAFIAISIYTIVEYRRYLHIKRVRKNNYSFKSYLKSKVSNQSKKEQRSNQLSDKTFELLDEIEKENTPDK